MTMIICLSTMINMQVLSFFLSFKCRGTLPQWHHCSDTTSHSWGAQYNYSIK